MQNHPHSLFSILSARMLVSLILFSFSSLTFAFEIQVYALFKDMAIIKVDGVQHKLKTGQTTPEGVKLISADSEEAILEVKGKRESYPLGENFSISFAEKKKMEARIWSSGGMYLTNGLINGKTVKFAVDTGASWVAMNREQADKIGVDYTFNAEPAVASTANGTTTVKKVLLKRVKVGDIELHNVHAAVMENSNPKYILLGNSFLDRVDMEREGGMMLLKEK